MKKIIIILVVAVLSMLTFFPIPIQTFQGRETYQLMSNGRYHCEDYSYEYKLTLTGKGQGMDEECSITVLSNRKEVTFEEAFKAIWTSVSTEFFDPKDAIIVDLD